MCNVTRGAGILTLALLGGCTAMEPRAARSPLGCARQAVAQVPAEWSDASKHCVVSGLIARQCSAGEARLAGWGKELRDAFGSGDASRADLKANAVGRGCAREASTVAALAACCESAGPMSNAIEAVTPASEIPW